MRIIVLLLALTTAASAQRLDLAALVGSGGAAYRSPRVTIIVSPSFASRHWRTAAYGSLIPTGKSDTRDGLTWSVRGEAAYDAGPIFLGGGFSHSETRTSLYEKQANHPYILVGGRVDVSELSVRWFLPQGDPRNRLTGPEVRWDFPLRGHWWLRTLTELYSARPTDQPLARRQAAVSVGGGILWRSH